MSLSKPYLLKNCIVKSCFLNRVFPNCIMKAKSERKRLFIGNQIDECRDCSGLYYLLPCDKGYITKWDVEKPIWDYVFSKNVCPINNYPVIMTQPLFNFKSIQDCIDEIFFEEYEVSSMFRLNPTDLVLLKYHKEKGSKPPCIIVDSGYSFTHVIPYLEGKKYLEAAKRINVGGKVSSLLHFSDVKLISTIKTALDQSFKRHNLLPPIPRNGRNVRNKPSQRRHLLRLSRLQNRPKNRFIKQK